MIYLQKINSELQIKTLKDLVKLKPFLEDGTLKINKSQIARKLGILPPLMSSTFI